MSLEKENHQVKVEALKSQINPHFLFNSLNNIYAFSNPENKSVRNYLVKLSDALRYMIYDSSEVHVPLQDEIAYLKNYVSLEKLRYDTPEQIQFTTEGDFSGRLIAPLILLTIIENCFKHGDRIHPIIDIHLKMDGEQITLSTQNNLDQQEVQKNGGLGIQNLKNRLQLIYPNKHILTIQEKEDQYYCQLQINLAQ